MKYNNFGGPKSFLISIIIVIGLIVTLKKLTEYANNITVFSYKQFIDAVKLGKVKSIKITGQNVEGFLVDGKEFETVIVNRDKDYDLFEEKGINIKVATTSSSSNLWYIFMIIGILMLIIIFTIWYFMGQAKNGKGGSSIFNIGRSRAKMFLPSTIKEKFSSVAGAHEAKEDLQEVVDFLKDSKRFKRLGAKITRGVLLVGEPGTGKTLLAKAVAGEANCPFFTVSGSDFVEVFVGVGAARVRDLFSQAKKNAPCIIFIDEIDAIGRQRGSFNGGNDEREQTLNQLLTEMDGFETSKEPIIILAATNRPDVLDKALLRPGRFDRKIEVPMPDLTCREQILSVHLKSIKADKNLDVKKIARGTPGFTGADLANLVNEATLIASKQNLDEVTMTEFEEARDRIMIGKESKTKILSELDRKITAYHESGHALIRLLMPDATDPLHKVTIIPRGNSMGVTHFFPHDEKFNRNKKECLASITSALGGRAAEELIFDELSTGAYSDFKAATAIARDMVCKFGMTDNLGKMVYLERYERNNYSEKTFEKIDEEIKSILDTQYSLAIKLLKENNDKLDKLAVALLDKETMYATEIYELLGIKPRENLKLI